MRKPSNLYSISAVARHLGTVASSLTYHQSAGNIARPTHSHGERLYYNDADVQVITRFWAARIPMGCSRYSHNDVIEMEILYNSGVCQKEIGARFGATQTLISYLLTRRVLPGWRGGKSGTGRVRGDRPIRCRNLSAVDDAPATL